MKKILCFVLLTMMLACVFAACSGESKTIDDPSTLAKKMEDKGYSVKVATDEEDLSSIAAELNISTKRLEEGLAISGHYSHYSSIVIYCDSSDTAKEVEEAFLKLIAEAEEKIKEIFVVKREGSAVFMGTESVWNHMQK